MLLEYNNAKNGRFQEASSGEPADFVTVLSSRSGVQAKQYSGNDLNCEPWSNSTFFDMYQIAVHGLAGLAKVLDALKQDQCIVVGKLCTPPKVLNSRRLLHADSENEPATLKEAAHYWLIIDFDGGGCPDGLDPVAAPERAVRYVISLLPEEFRGAECWWQLTASAGIKPGIRLRLAFWLDRKLKNSEVKRWLSEVDGVDGKICTPNQPIYAAKPIFRNGAVDPVPRRSGIIKGGSVSPPTELPLGTKPAFHKIAGAPAKEGKGYLAKCSVIGDYNDGRQGFFEPIKSAVAGWISSNPGEDTTWLRADIERVIRAAHRDPSLHDDAYIETRVRDLDSLIADITKRENAKPTPDWVEEMNKSFAVTRFGTKSVIALLGEKEIVFLKKEDFLMMHENKFTPGIDGEEPKQKGPQWLKHRRRHERLSGVVFEPAAKPIERPGTLNLWRGFAVKPKQGDWSLMQAHIENVLADGNEEHSEYIFNWMAYGVQHPGLPAEVALCFKSLPGGGKGVVWRNYGSLFAPHFRHFNNPDQFTSRFNGSLGKSVFVLLDEAIWGGDRQVEGKIKAMITEPTLPIELKHVDAMEVDNHLSIVACSNEDWAVPVGIGDRRWFVANSSNKYSFKECDPAVARAYFKPLYAEMDKGGREAMLYDLLRRQVTADDIRNVPNTEAKAALKSRALTPTPAWVEMILQEGEIPAFGQMIGGFPWDPSELVVDKDIPYESYTRFCSLLQKAPCSSKCLGEGGPRHPGRCGGSRASAAGRWKEVVSQDQVRAAALVPGEI
jgi:hypothetical protein